MYTDAQTSVILNGHVSKPFKVRRGVRQGDPMSCLLFNIAIESLGQALRKLDLKGIKIDESMERIIEAMFADNTMVYLVEDDSFQDHAGAGHREQGLISQKQ